MNKQRERSKCCGPWSALCGAGSLGLEIGEEGDIAGDIELDILSSPENSMVEDAKADDQHRYKNVMMYEYSFRLISRPSESFERNV